MQIGDPKKTVVLAIVAVGAIGFCFKQLTGGGDSVFRIFPKTIFRIISLALSTGSGGMTEIPPIIWLNRR